MDVENRGRVIFITYISFCHDRQGVLRLREQDYKAALRQIRII